MAETLLRSESRFPAAAVGTALLGLAGAALLVQAGRLGADTQLLVVLAASAAQASVQNGAGFRLSSRLYWAMASLTRPASRRSVVTS